MKSRKQHFRASADAGFTLIETLVALSLMALIASFLNGGIVFGRRAWENASDRDEVFVVDAVNIALREVLQRVVPYRPIPNQPVLAFEGLPNTLSFISLGDAEVEIGGLTQNHFRVVSRVTRELDFTYSSSPLRLSEARVPSLSTRPAQILLGNVESVRFRYFGSPEKGQAHQWFDSWAGYSRLPKLIECKGVVVSGTRRSFEVVIDMTYRE